MSTLADELLNDFEDTGSEGEGEQHNGFLQASPSPPASGLPNGHPKINGSVPADDAEEDEDEDTEMLNGSTGMEDAEDEEETKAKVEKMQLGGVSDVRNVAGLMKTLGPVLEVGSSKFVVSSILKHKIYISTDIALTFPPASRK